jgi:hypothetical protein
MDGGNAAKGDIREPAGLNYSLCPIRSQTMSLTSCSTRQCAGDILQQECPLPGAPPHHVLVVPFFRVLCGPPHKTREI